jgi:TRAP-type C4-dicarboxylate transport system permease small subunit
VFKGLNRALNHLEEWLIATLIAAATALIFLAVLHRYGTGVSIDLSKWLAARGVPIVPGILKTIYLWLAALDVSWAQELCIYMFIWMAKFGAAYGVRTGIHVGVDVLIKRLNPEWQKGVVLFGLLGGALFTAIVGTMGLKFVVELMSTDQVSPDLELPSWLVYACIPLGSYLMCFRFLQVSWTYFWTGDLPHHDATHVDGIEVSAKAPVALGEA